MFPINYGDKFPWNHIQEDEIVYMADFSLEPFSDMVKLNKICDELIWIDHHESAIQEYKRTIFDSPPLILGWTNTNFAACELTWKWINKGKSVPLAVSLLGRYDIWNENSIFWRAKILPFQQGMKTENWMPTSNTVLEKWRRLRWHF